MLTGVNPQSMQIPWNLALAANSSKSGYTVPTPTLSTPAGTAATGAGTGAVAADNAIIRMGGAPSSNSPDPKTFAVYNNLKLVGFGDGAATNTFSTRIYGWSQINPTSGKGTWVPTFLCELQWTLGATTGIASSDFPNGTSDLIAHNVSITTGNANVDVKVVSPGNNNTAYALIDVSGFAIVQIQFTTGGSATNDNLLYAPI